MAASLATRRAPATLTPRKRPRDGRPGHLRSEIAGPDLPVIRGKPESISRIPLDATQDTRV